MQRKYHVGRCQACDMLIASSNEQRHTFLCTSMRCNIVELKFAGFFTTNLSRLLGAIEIEINLELFLFYFIFGF